MDDETKEIFEERLKRLRTLSERLDESFKIPGTKYKIGIDPIIGLIPVGGDLIGGILSTYIMYSGMKMGASPKIITQMAVNIVIEFAVGSIPIIGDLFDFFWKANKKNMELIEEVTLEKKRIRGTNYLILAALLVASFAIIFIILGAIA